MKITGKVHILFEQSGTFKGAFAQLGYNAIDYDYCNDYNQTDVVCDIFRELENAELHKPSIFSNFKQNDLILAFFPCTYFSCQSQLSLFYYSAQHRNLNPALRWDYILARVEKRNKYYSYLLRLFRFCHLRGLRLIVENPWSSFTFLKNNLPFIPSYIDTNRSTSGDKFRKPTAYWFINCKPHHLQSFLVADPVPVESVHGFERSIITLDYAHNFICDKILGISSGNFQQLDLFEQ